MKRQFVVGDELQQFLSSLPSASLTNVVWDSAVDVDSAALPFNPSAVKRMLVYSKSAFSEDATPNPDEYNSYLVSLDMTYTAQITFPRGI